MEYKKIKRILFPTLVSILTLGIAHGVNAQDFSPKKQEAYVQSEEKSVLPYLEVQEKEEKNLKGFWIELNKRMKRKFGRFEGLKKSELYYINSSEKNYLNEKENTKHRRIMEGIVLSQAIDSLREECSFIEKTCKKAEELARYLKPEYDLEEHTLGIPDSQKIGQDDFEVIRADDYSDLEKMTFNNSKISDSINPGEKEKHRKVRAEIIPKTDGFELKPNFKIEYLGKNDNYNVNYLYDLKDDTHTFRVGRKIAPDIKADFEYTFDNGENKVFLGFKVPFDKVAKFFRFR